MNPQPFKQANVNLLPPKGMANCDSLPVYRYNDPETKSTVWLSCWKMGWRERLSVLLSGKVWLWVHQFTHPPVALTGQSPFADLSPKQKAKRLGKNIKAGRPWNEGLM